MPDNDFFIEKQRAVERMKQMQKRSQNGMPPTPQFVSLRDGNKNKSSKREQDFKGEIKNKNALFDLPVLKDIDIGGDTSLLISLLMLLMGENSDKLLLYAIIYILM